MTLERWTMLACVICRMGCSLLGHDNEPVRYTRSLHLQPTYAKHPGTHVLCLCFYYTFLFSRGLLHLTIMMAYPFTTCI